MVMSAYAMRTSHDLPLAIILVLLVLLWRHDLLQIRLIVLSYVSVLLIELEQLGSLLLIEVITLRCQFGLHFHEILLVELLVAAFFVAILVAALLFTTIALLALFLAALTLFFVLLCES